MISSIQEVCRLLFTFYIFTIQDKIKHLFFKLQNFSVDQNCDKSVTENNDIINILRQSQSFLPEHVEFFM